MSKKDLFTFLKNTINSCCSRKFILKLYCFASKDKEAQELGKKSEYMCLVDYDYKDFDCNSDALEAIIDINNQEKKPNKYERVFENVIIVLDKVEYTSTQDCKNVVVKSDKQVETLLHDNLVFSHLEVLDVIDKLNFDDIIKDLLSSHYLNRYGLKEKDISEMRKESAVKPISFTDGTL